jgi:hypothetical protein
MLATACRALAGAGAERGLLVVLEDLQWADRTSLLLLRHLAGDMARSRLLVVATFREAADAPLAGLVPALLRVGARLIRLTGLSRQDIAQWLRRAETGGDVDTLAGRLRAGTGGNPLFVRMLVERGPSAAVEGLTGFPELRHLVLAHLDGLGEPARELLDAASVLGERIDLQVLADVSGRSPAEVGTVLDQAVARGVLTSLGCRSRTPSSGTRYVTSWPRRGGWRGTSGPPARWSGPGTPRPAPGRSPATGSDLVRRAARRTACGGPARRPGRRRRCWPTTRRSGSPCWHCTPRRRTACRREAWGRVGPRRGARRIRRGSRRGEPRALPGGGPAG